MKPKFSGLNFVDPYKSCEIIGYEITWVK
jgi:hypothetical protein